MHRGGSSQGAAAHHEQPSTSYETVVKWCATGITMILVGSEPRKVAWPRFTWGYASRTYWEG